MAKLIVGTDGGLNVLGDEGSRELAGHAVGALVAEGDGLWAIVDGRSVWRRDDGAWREVATSDDLRLNCLLPTGRGLYVGTSEAHMRLLVGDRLERVESFDRARGRDDWYTPWGGPPDVRSMSLAPDGAVYANVHVGGILRSAGGESWHPTIEVDADVHEVLAHGDRVLAACAWGLAESTDAGATWFIKDEGLHAPYARAVAVSNGRILLTASTGPRTSQAAVYRRDLGGGRFERMHTGLPEWFGNNVDTGCLDAEGPVAAFGTGDGSVYLSTDGGEMWERIAEGLPRLRCVVVATD